MKQTKLPFLRTGAAILTALLASSSPALSLSGLPADQQISSGGTISDVTPMNVGYSGSTCYNSIVVFQLPTLAAGQQFSAASLSFYCLNPDGTPGFNADLYALPGSTSSAISASSFYAGPSDPAATLIQDNLLTPSSSGGRIGSSAAAITSYLNAVYANGAGAGKYVFFRLNPDMGGLNNFTRYKVYSADYSGGSFYWPALSYSTTATVSSGWTTVPLGGGGFVTGLASNASGSCIYCRTDVGGAFRWSPSGDTAGNGSWISISDDMVSYNSPGAGSLMGVESIATDPNAPARVYLAAGDGIYQSDDQGSSWSLISGAIDMDPNGPYRSNGERLAVDPNNSNLLWYGSRSIGLQKGVKSGGIWSWTQVSTASVPVGAGGGVTFVVCDKNSGATITYAGVNDATVGGIYKSTDGNTWTKLTVASGSLFLPARAQITSNGTLYVTGGAAGAFKLLRGASSLTQLASLPTGQSYRGVAVSSADATGQTVYIAASTSPSISRSVDGGATWTTQSSMTQTRMEPDGTPCLTGYWFGNTSSLLINPANENELWAGDFFGVARTRNAQNLGGAGSTWFMLQKGQDETVVETLKNAPTGPKLMTGVADVGGFRYNSINERPTGVNGNSFGAGNTTSLDYCEGNANIWTRGYYGTNSNGSGAWSMDGGVNWLFFGQVAFQKVATGATGLVSWDVSNYLATQKAKGTGKLTLIVATNTTPNHSNTALSFHSREAVNTALRPQLLINGSTVVNCEADSYVSGATANTTTNYGSSATLNASHSFTLEIVNDRHIYLRFDISGISSITSASLRLNLAAAAANEYPAGVFACANTAWVEGNGGTDNLPAGELTWSNRPLPYANSASGRNPFAEPRYKTGAGASLQGGRVAVSSTDGNRLVWMPFGTSVVPHYSNDRGVTWSPCTGLPTGVNRLAGKSNPSYLIQQVTADRGNGQFYIVQLSSGSGNHTVYRSADGAAWTSVGTINAATFNIYRAQIVAAPAAGDVWFCDDGVNGTTKGGLWRSTNSGATWSKIPGTITAVRQVAFGKAAGASGYTVFINGYKSGVRGIYRSDDYGVNWTKLPDPTINDINSLAGDRQTYGRVYIGTDGRGVFVGQ